MVQMSVREWERRERANIGEREIEIEMGEIVRENGTDECERRETERMGEMNVRERPNGKEK